MPHVSASIVATLRPWLGGLLVLLSLLARPELAQAQTPTISYFSPGGGVAGTVVTITGTNFTGASAVRFNGTSAAFSVTNSTTISATVPAGATTGPVSVTTASGTAASAATFTVCAPPSIVGFVHRATSGGKFYYAAATAATWSSARTACLTAGGHLVAINSAAENTLVAGIASSLSQSLWIGFSDVTSEGSFTWSNADPVTYLNWNFGEPNNSGDEDYAEIGTTGGWNDVNATTSRRYVLELAPACQIVPTITTFAPNSGAVGATVTLTGANFTGATAVRFNGTSATFTVVNPNTITATVPAGTTTGPLSVTTPSGTATSAGSFTFIPAPIITSFTPTSGPAGTTVTITGASFTGATVVRFNGTSATFSVTNATTISATVPGSATSGTIGVTTPGGTGTSAGSFTVVPLSITSLSPTRNLRNAGRASNVETTFSQPMEPNFFNLGAVRVFSQQRGGRMYLAQGGNTYLTASTIMFNPATDFRPGETVMVTTMAGATATSGATLARGDVRQFTTAAGAGPGVFTALADPAVGGAPIGVAIGDVDGDGDLDVVTANSAASTVSVRLNGGDATGSNTGAFSGGTDPAVGANPMSVALGDVDGDGDLDLLTTNYGSGASVGTTVSVRLNNGSGTFAGGSEVSVGSGPASLALGDYDGDGDLDLAAANYYGNSVSIRLNDGTGAFGGGTNPGGLVNPQQVVTGDVDGDGDLDLLTIDSSNGIISVLRNDGAAGFTISSTVSVGGNARTLALGDVDGDGDLDFVTANSAAATMRVGTNNGAGTFALGAPLSIPTVPYYLALADVDGDGDLDLLTAHHDATGLVSVRLNNGSGTFSGATDVSVGSSPRAVAVGDVDGDGDLDFIAPSYAVAGTASVRYNNRPPTALALSNATIAENTGDNAVVGTLSTTDPDAGGTHTYTLVSGTGDADNALVNISGTQLRITADPDFEAKSSYAVRVRTTDQRGGYFERAFTLTITNMPMTLTGFTPTSGPIGTAVTVTGTDLGGATSARVNGTAGTITANTRTSLTFTMAPGSATGQVSVVAPAGTATSSSLTPANFTVEPLTITAVAPSRNQPSAPRAGDVAITFSQPMQSTTANEQAVRVFSQQRGGRMFGTTGGAASVSGSTITFNPANDFKPGETVQVTTLASATTLGGGTLAAGHVHSFTAAAGAGPGVFEGTFNVNAGANPLNVVVGDVDGDGDLDLVTANAGALVTVSLNNGAGTYAAGVPLALTTNTRALALGDVDGDGDLDLLTANAAVGSTVGIRTNNGVGTFSSAVNVSVGSNPYAVALGDIDGDGDLDLLATSHSGAAVAVRFNDGAGTFSGILSVSVGSQPRALALADYDLDGDLDFFTANYGGNSVSLKINNGSGGFSGSTTISVGTGPAALAVGDYDGDGDPDLATADEGANVVTVLRNNSGTYGSAANLNAGFSPQGVALADVDGDGVLDLLVTARITNIVRVFFGTGGGAFGSAATYGVSAAPVGLATGDADGDGDLDLFVAHDASSGPVSVLFNNRAPALTNSSTLTYVENDAPLVLNAGITVADANHPTLPSGAVRVTANYVAGEDILSFANVPGTMGNIVSAYSMTTGVLTLTSAGATATLAQWQAALRAVRYTNLSDNPSASVRTVSFTVSDGYIISPAVTTTVNVTPVNDLPTATNLDAAETYTEDVPRNLTDIVVTDPDSPVTVTLTLSVPAAGSLTTGTAGSTTSTYNAGIGEWSATGPVAEVNTLLANLAFNPALHYNASFAIATTVREGMTLVLMGTKPVTGIAVNDAPTGTNLSAAQTYTEDTPLALTPIVTADVDNAAVSVWLNLSAPAAGTLSTGTSGTVTSTYNAGTGQWNASGPIADVNAVLASVVFTPAPNYNASFTITTGVSDGALITPGSKAMTGTAVNDPPTAPTDANAAPNEVTENADLGTPVGITAQSTDVETGTLIYSLTDNAGGRFQISSLTGVVTVANGSLLDYETATQHTITVRAWDGSAGTTQTFTITLTDQPLTLTGLAPASGPVGTSVTLTGTDLAGATLASVNGTAAVIAASAPGSVVLTVAPGTTTGAVSVTAPGGTATGGIFTVTPLPTLTGFAPASGPPGTVVTLTGTDLSAAVGVTFNGVLTTALTVVSGTTLTAVVPVGATTGALAVTLAGGVTATAPGAFVVEAATPDAFVTVTPAGPLSACFSPVLQAAAYIRPFAPTGAGPDGNVLAIAVQPDGRVIIGGVFTFHNGAYRARVARLLPDGTLDASFVPTGNGLNNFVSAVAVQPDGKILVGGQFSSYNGVSRPYVARLLPNGALDNSFALTGAGLNGQVAALAVQPDGKILIGGMFSSYNGVSRPFVARLHADGSLDTSFAPTGAGLNAPVLELAVQPDGNVVIGGAFSAYNGIPRPSVARLHADGSLDASFAPVGTGLNGTVDALALQPDGRVVVGGLFNAYNGTIRGRVARLLPNGSLDNSFVPTGGGFNGPVLTLAVQPDGKVLASGQFTLYNGTGRLYVARLLPDGSLDGSFAPTGAGPNNFVGALALQPDGRPLVGGAFTSHNGVFRTRIARLNADGSLHSTNAPAPATYVWSPGGSTSATVAVGAAGGAYQATATVSGHPFLSNTVTVIDCLPVVSGFTPTSGPAGTLVTVTGVNLANATGAAVNGTAGTNILANTPTTLTFAVGAGSTSGPVSVTTFGGTATSSATFTVTPAPVITGFSPANGVPGTAVTISGTDLGGATGVTFNGVPTTSITAASATSLTALVPVGATTGRLRLTLGGGATATSAGDFTVDAIVPDAYAQVTPGGTVSACATTLTATAYLRPFALSGAANSPVSAVAVQPDGRILVGGQFTGYNGSSRPYVARLTRTGITDPSFNPGSPSAPVYAVAALADGRVLLGGQFAQFNGLPRASVARLTAAGALDGSFVPTGTGLNGAVFVLAPQPDGKVLVGGSFTQYNGTARGGVARLNADGSLDNTFAPAGFGLNGVVYALAVQPDGKVLVGGSFTQYNGVPRSYMARLNTDGSLDNTFFPLGSPLNGPVYALAVQPDGRVLVGGSFTQYGGAPRPYVARLLADGALDASFAPAGSGLNNVVYALAVQPDGAVLVGGSFTQYNGTGRPYAARLTATGALDASFAPVGTGLNGQVNALALQPDGEVLAGGNFTTYNTLNRAYVARLTTTGALDDTATPAAGATVGWSPTGATGATLVTDPAGGTYQATVTVGGYAFLSNPVTAVVCPTLTSFSPTGGVPGTLVTVTGADLTSVRGVSFNGVLSRSLTFTSPTTLTTIVPVGATTGPIRLTDALSGSVSSATDFTVLPALPDVVTTVTPAGQLSACGATLTAAATVRPFAPTGSGLNGPVYALTTQYDGKAIVGGAFNGYNGAFRPFAARLAADGSLDNAFAPVGNGLNNNVLALAMQADGRLLVGGGFNSYHSSARPYVARLLPNGALDGTFVPVGSGLNGQVSAVAVQPDGKVIVGGSFTSYNGTARNGLARLNADGSLDASFVQAGSGPNGAVSAVAVQPDGRIVVGGQFTQYAGAPCAHIARLSANGSLDLSFLPAGSGLNGPVAALAVQPDGKVLVGGQFTAYNGTARPYVARLLTNGSLDNSFAPVGPGLNGVVYALAPRPDGTVLVGGSFTQYSGANRPYVARLTATGALDGSFGPSGSGLNGAVYALTAQPDGKVLVGGNFTSYSGQSRPYVARLTATGALDNVPTPASGATYAWMPTGATGATTTPDPAGGAYQATATVSGYTFPSNTVTVVPCPIITGFTPASGVPGTVVTLTGTHLTNVRGVAFGGVLSPSFAVSGGTSLTAVVPVGAVTGPIRLTDAINAAVSSTTDFTVLPTAPDVVTTVTPPGPVSGCAVPLTASASVRPFAPVGSGLNGGVFGQALQADGKLLVGGGFTSYNATPRPNVARLHPDGSLDASFAPVGSGLNSTVNKVVALADGKVLVGGQFTGYNGTYRPYVARLNADGSLDASFVQTGSGLNGPVAALAAQPDGKVLVGGSFSSYNGTIRAYVVRLNADGSLDNSFVQTGSGLNGMVSALALQPDGKVLVGGSFTGYNGTYRPYVARLLADGSLDNTFAPVGSGLNNSVYALAVQPDGKVLLGGNFTQYNGTFRPFVARLNADGSLDASFAPTGAGLSGYVLALAVQPDGRVVVGGGFAQYNGVNRLYVARLTATGSLDGAFFQAGTGLNNVVTSALVQPDGKVLVGGHFNAYNGQSRPYVARLRATGSLDNVPTPAAGATYAWTPTGATGATTPPDPAGGVYQATATVSGYTFPSNVVTVVPCPPTITAISPAAELPGMPVTLTGTAFTAGTSVTFGGVAGTNVVVTSTTSLTVTVPAAATPGSSAVEVTNASGSSSSAPAFTVLSVYAASTVGACVGTVPYTTTGDGEWHYLLATTGQVVAALRDTRAALGTVSVEFKVIDAAGPVRQDTRGQRYLDRNFHLTATNPVFAGSSVQLRFFGLTSEFDRLQAVTPSLTYPTLKSTQYSGPNEDCELANDNFVTGQARTLAAPASAPGNGIDWFVATVTVPDHFSEFYLTGSAGTLPVELVRFTAERTGGTAVATTWQTASERESRGFIVHRSLNGRDFTAVSGLIAGAGTSNAPHVYAWADKAAPTATVYYRLLQLDYDGTAAYSAVVAVAPVAGAAPALVVWPNPATGAVRVSGASAAPLELLDATGRVVRTVVTPAATTELNLTGLPPGVYVVRCAAATARLVVE